MKSLVNKISKIRERRKVLFARSVQALHIIGYNIKINGNASLVPLEPL
jgi:hypothetical protein